VSTSSARADSVSPGAPRPVSVQARNLYTSGNYYVGVWLNIPAVTSVRNGYQLRIGDPAGSTYELELIKWVNGTATVLKKLNGASLGVGSNGGRFALVDKGGTVSVWYAQSGLHYHQAFSVADSTYSYGYAAIEADGPSSLGTFKLGPLPLY